MPSAPVLDTAQLQRIEAVHRGFLYQHLYASGCLLLASAANATAVVVEADEDVQIIFPDRHLYVQVKTRAEALTFGDIESAMCASLRSVRHTRTGAERVRLRSPSSPMFLLAPTSEGGPWLRTGRQTFGSTGPATIRRRRFFRHRGPTWPKDLQHALSLPRPCRSGCLFRRRSFGSWPV